MTRTDRLGRDDPKYKATVKTSFFMKRLNEVKRDPSISPFAGLVSGLFENSEWVFVCSEHLTGRFVDEEKLKAHFNTESHRRSVTRRSSSMYD